MQDTACVLLDPDALRGEALARRLGASGALRVTRTGTVSEAEAALQRGTGLVLVAAERNERAELARLRARAPAALIFALHAPGEREARQAAQQAGFDGALPWEPAERLEATLLACARERP
ncbi:MAG: hypothetical protein HY909_31555 [Deltaproteobacteria bacterium]|nr:hypothetical protein [Deltaproteobacteria bacterium]